MSTDRTQQSVEEAFAVVADNAPTSHETGIDDLQGSALANRKLDGGQLAVVAVELPLGSGITFPMYKWDINDIPYCTYQTAHRCKKDGTFNDHVHVCTDKNPTGKRVKFQIDGVFAGVKSKYAKVPDSPWTKEFTFPGDWSRGNFIIDLLDTVNISPTVSSLIKFRIKRVQASQDDVANSNIKFYLDFHDAHVENDQIFGSRQMAVK